MTEDIFGVDKLQVTPDLTGDCSGANAAQIPKWIDMYQALAWVRFRDAKFAKNADADSLMSEQLWPTRKAIAGRLELTVALRYGHLVAEGAKSEGEWDSIPAAQWQKLPVTPRQARDHAPYEFIRIHRDELMAVFPPLVPARATYDENVKWCREWIENGRGNGMDQAWPHFARESRHKGTSRDNFRQAWNEAKGRKSV